VFKPRVNLKPDSIALKASSISLRPTAVTKASRSCELDIDHACGFNVGVRSEFWRGLGVDRALSVPSLVFGASGPQPLRALMALICLPVLAEPPIEFSTRCPRATSLRCISGLMDPSRSYVGGADGSIGVGRAARARPDGYTLCVGTLGTHVQNGAFYSLSYDVLHGFVPIIPLASIPFVLFARKGIPADNLKDLVAWLKAHPTRRLHRIAKASTPDQIPPSGPWGSPNGTKLLNALASTNAAGA
jgi:hypothetical protein